MARTSTSLANAPPYSVERALARVGANLRTARLRRNLTVAEVARKIGSGPRSVADAEKGKPGTAAAVYAALLWAYDLLSPLETVADPTLDVEGLANVAERKRARPAGRGGLDNDF